MDDCIFCKIVKGKVPSKKVFEDKDFFAFLDINPLNPGHSLVVPKKHYRWTWDVPNFGEYWEVAKKVAKGIMKATKAPMIEFLTHGTDVYHAHIWVVPVFEGEEGFIDASDRKKLKESEMEEISQKITKSI